MKKHPVTAMSSIAALASAFAMPSFAQMAPGNQSGIAATPTGGVQGAQSSAEATAPPAVAAAPREVVSDGGDIIVTARRVEERLQDVPISITVFNQQQISNSNIINAGDLATYTPSLTSNPNFGNEYTSFAIRGFIQDPQTAPTVGVYFADVVVPRGPTQGTQAGDGAGPGALFDLQNVQVLKGPQGTLFGRNTTGGAVLFVPQKPTGKLGGFLEGSYGNYDYKRVQGAINLPLSDTARLRVAGDYLNRNGFLKNTTGVGPRDFNDINYYSLRASLVVDLMPDLENYTIASYTHSNTNGTDKKLIAASASQGPSVGGFPSPLNFLPTTGALLFVPALNRLQAANAGFYGVQNDVPNPRSRIDQWQIINTTTWRASDSITIKNIASYGQLSAFQRSPLFGTDLQFGGQRFEFSIINPAPGFKTVDQETYTEELQLQGNALDGKLTYQAGAYYEGSEPLSQIGNQSNTFLPCANVNARQCTDVVGAAYTSIIAQAFGPFAFPLQIGGLNYTVGTTSFRDIGIYSQASFSLTDRLKLTGGIRYTWDRTSNTSTRAAYRFPVTAPFTQAPTANCTDNPAIAFTGVNCVSTTRQKSNAPTWLIDLDYKPADGLLLYAKYARGYRAGGVSPNSPTTFRAFNAEKLDAYEGGLKATMRGSVQGTFNVAGFYNNFSNQQIQAGFFPAPGANVTLTSGPVNAGKSRIYGADVDASISPFRGFWIDGSYTYLKTKIRSIATIANNDPNYIVSYQIIPGDPLLLSPRNKYSLTARYTLPVDRNVGQIMMAATVTHSDHYETTYAYLHNPALRNGYGGRDLGKIPGFTLLNANLDWKSVAGTPVDLSVFATNLTKKKYYTYTAGLGSVGFESANVGEPRFYGARIRYNFGR